MTFDAAAADLISRLRIASGWCVYECIEGTWEFESDRVTLSFVIDGSCVEIRNLAVRRCNGCGHRILEHVHATADEYGLSVSASNVRENARGFWQKMGYEEGTCLGEFFRCI